MKQWSKRHIIPFGVNVTFQITKRWWLLWNHLEPLHLPLRPKQKLHNYKTYKRDYIKSYFSNLPKPLVDVFKKQGRHSTHDPSITFMDTGRSRNVCKPFVHAITARMLFFVQKKKKKKKGREEKRSVCRSSSKYIWNE